MFFLALNDKYEFFFSPMQGYLASLNYYTLGDVFVNRLKMDVFL